MENEIKWEQVRTWLLWLALPLIVGLLISSLIPQPVVGIIRLNDAIYGYTARDMIAQMDYALEHPEVRAVVLAFDSPGGTVVDTEAIYMALTRLREKKPVVTAVNGMSASGAYYLSVNTDYIYAKPTSMVGNIGVIGYLPSPPFIFEEMISTGPYKLWGSPRDSEMRQIDMIKEGFFQAVELGRKGRKQPPREVILSGQIWNGIEAARIGIIDEIGSEHDALEKAAQLARVANYKTVDLRDLAIQTSVVSQPFFVQSPDGVKLPYPNEAGIYLLYIPPMPVKP